MRNFDNKNFGNKEGRNKERFNPLIRKQFEERKIDEK